MVGISLVDTVVTNLSDPVVLTFFHDQLPVGGETASLNLIPPGMEEQRGLGPCQLRKQSQSSRSMPLACLYGVSYIFWSCITINTRTGGGAACVCPGDAALQICHLQHNIQG